MIFDFIILFILIESLLGIIVCIYLFIRVEWVYRVNMYYLENNKDVFNKLPTLHYMVLNQLEIWNRNYYLKYEKNN